MYIDMDFDGLRSDIVQMLGGEHVKVNTCSFQNDMRNLKVKDDVLTFLIHLGYLGYDSELKEAFIPNKEIFEKFESAMGKILLVAVNYDKDRPDKPHSCLIEKVKKQ